MKHIKFTTLFFATTILLAFNSSCQEKDKSINFVSADSLNVIIKNKPGILLDVRTPEEFAEGHIPGAININYHDPGFEAALDTLDKNKEYEVYCRSGKRSGESVAIMSKKGFKKINHLEGGILKWQEKGFEVVK